MKHSQLNNLLLFVLMLSSELSNATNYIMQNATVTVDCSISNDFFDSGGSGDYSKNENYVMTFCPSTAGTYVQFNFSLFHTNDSDDKLTFYDGNSTAAPVIGTYFGNYPTTAPFSPLIIGAMNASGCITVEFTSGALHQNEGWQAAITCSTSPVEPTVITMTDGANLSVCGGKFLDPGGYGDYLKDDHRVVTFCPSTPNTYIQLDFEEFLTQSSGHAVTFYDGNSTSAPILGTYWGNYPTNSPNTPLTISAKNVTGCLTVEFTSGSTHDASGWIANISCVTTLVDLTIITFTDNTDLESCNSLFLDSGGYNDYLKSDHRIATICPSISGYPVQVDFSQFSVVGSDPLLIYDGNSVSAPLIGTYTSNPGIITASNPSNCLTFEFTSGGIHDDDGWQANITCFGIPLPVKLLNFDVALVENNLVELQWKTEQEINSNHFVIQKSIENGTFVSIGKITAAGNSTETTEYNFYDTTPIAGLQYYRLRQVDYDGTEYFSKIRSVNVPFTEEISVFPNPFEQNVTVDFNLLQNSEVSIKLSDITGKVVFSNQYQLSAGDQSVKLEDAKISSLAKGIYFVKISDKNGTKTQKLVKN